MKRFYLFLSVLFIAIVIGGCTNNEPDLSSEEGYSKLTVKTGIKSGDTKSVGESTENVLFTGSDILWYNESTNEIRFKDNYYQYQYIPFHTDIKFYLENEYLFSLIKVSDLNSQIYNSPVLYYNMTKNKFYINDGYPDISVLKPQKEIQDKRDDNVQAIANEWDKFISYLKKVNKDKNR